MKTTKEQLLASHTELQTNFAVARGKIERLENEDHRLRSRFSTVLRQRHSGDDRFNSGISYAGSRTSEPLSWEEIFCEVGKLLMCNYSEEWRKRIEGDMETLQQRIFAVDQK